MVLELLYPLTRDGLLKAALHEYHAQRQAMSKFSLAALLLSEPMLKIVRREIRRFSPEVNVGVDDIKDVLMEEVLKREVVEGERADDARKRLSRALKRQLRATASRDGASDEVVTEAEEISDATVAPLDE